MKDYGDWIQERIVKTKQETTKYSAKHENKEVRVYSENDCVYVHWYIDGRLIEKPRFPKESIDEINLFVQTLYGECIDKHLMYKILNTMKRYLSYLEDEENPIGSLKYINIVGEIELE